MSATRKFSSTKMPPVTAYGLKKDRLALLDDIINILKDERLKLSSSCISRLEDCLMAKLEPTLIPHDHDDPNRAINMARSARLQKPKVQLGLTRIEKRTTTSKHTAKSHRRPDFIPHVRFGTFGGTRNVHESFMDCEFIRPDGAPDDDEDPAVAAVEKKRLEASDKLSSNVFGHNGGPRNIHESFVAGPNIAFQHKLTEAVRLRARMSKDTKPNKPFHLPITTLQERYLRTPLGMRRHIFLLPQHHPGFRKDAPQCGSICPIDIKEGGCLVFEGKMSVQYQVSGFAPAARSPKEAEQAPSVPASKTSNKVIEQGTRAGYQPEDISASEDVVAASPELTVIKVDHKIVQKTDAGDDTDVALQDTPESTLSQYQEALTQFQGPSTGSQDALNQAQISAVIQTIDPKDLFQPPPPAVPGRKKRTSKAPKKVSAVEINPRRSSRLAEKPKPAMQAPKKAKAAKSPAPQVLKPNAKRGRVDDQENDKEGGEERGGDGIRNKRILSRAVVEKQREARGKETTKRSGGCERDWRTAWERRGV
ncbi:hypothetical protein G6011_11730 [Alternaria panax]|uniref:Uncharacterized protein n=1 Tax=Alternaria panax TaxID=48097 RepID=A0AAD4NQE4_9PLEO|nr:hypothetical protein G6011_11730 [Alternaria panax]